MGSTQVYFEVDDIEEPWTFTRPFDFIHGKWLAGSIRDWPRLMQQCRDNVNPGGWVEFMDWDYTPRLADGSIEVRDNYVKKWHHIMMNGCEVKTGASASPGPLLKDLMTNAGFEDIKETVFKVPVGAWPRDKKLKEVGRFYRSSLEDGLDAISLRILTTFLGWDPLEAKVLNAHIRAEMKTVTFYHVM